MTYNKPSTSYAKYIPVITDDGSGWVDEQEYPVEKIVNKRVRRGVVEYYLKWMGYSDDENTWEVEDNIDCPELIAEFEEIQRKNEMAKKAAEFPKKTTNRIARKNKLLAFAKKARGFDCGLEPEKIVGATDVTGELMFMLKWKNVDEADLISAEQAKIHCPQVVIAFFEQNLKFYE